MTKPGKHRCGCDCKNQTAEVSAPTLGTGTAPAPRPCCAAWPDGTPCRYVALFECFHDWPLWTDSSPCSGIPAGSRDNQVPVGVTLNEDSPGGDLCTIPSPLGLTFPAMELIRDCLPDVDETCSFTCRLYNNNKLLNGTQTHMAPAYLADVTPGAVQGAFPPRRVNGTGGFFEYVKAIFRRIVDNPTYGNTEADPDHPSCTHDEDGQDLWKLTIGSAPAVLEWVYDHVLDQMPQFGPAGTGTGTPNAHRPRYEAIAAWDLWGRNTMVLQNPEDWPALPPRICVAALPTGDFDNPCDTHAAQCACCDTGFDAATLTLNIAGCGRVSGPRTVSVTRQFGAPPYCGVSEPDAPCGWFWTELGAGGSNCQTGGTPEYSGNVGLLIYCDGTDYHIDAYCYRTDTACWELAGAATITSYECTCDGPSFTFTLPTLECCCEDSPCDCTCTPPATLYADFSSTCSGMSANAVPFTQNGSVWEADTGSLPSSITQATLSCHDGTWYLALLFLPAACVETDDPTTDCTCEPFEATFVITIDSTCCPPSGGTIIVTFTE